MTVLNFEAFAKTERLDAHVQMKTTKSERERLDRVVSRLHEMGYSEVTRSSLARTLLVSGLAGAEAALDEDD